MVGIWRMVVERRRVCCRTPGMIIDAMRAGRRSRARALGWWHPVHRRELRPRRRTRSTANSETSVRQKCLPLGSNQADQFKTLYKYTVPKQYSLWCAAYVDIASAEAAEEREEGRSSGCET